MMESGYDLPVMGLENGQFYVLHILALCSIFISLISASAVIIILFRTYSFRTFFSWSKSERLVMYLAICDGGFNICHSLDHLHILMTKDHVRPLALCVFYGVNLFEFVFAQTLMVNIVAINVFVMIYFRKNMDLGKKDWRLLLWTYGTPLVLAIVCVATDQFGPSGAYCFLDGVKASVSNVFLTTIPMCLILVANTVLYGLTWYRINNEAKRMKNTLGSTSTTVKASHRVARNMFLFLTAFFIQWWAAVAYGIWLLFTKAPFALMLFVTIFSNIGGVLNGVVYAIIRRRRRVTQSDDTREGKTQQSVVSPPKTDVIPPPKTDVSVTRPE